MCHLNTKNPSLDLTEFSKTNRASRAGPWGEGRPSGTLPAGRTAIQSTKHNQDSGVTHRMGVWSLSSPFSALSTIKDNRDDPVLFGSYSQRSSFIIYIRCFKAKLVEERSRGVGRHGGQLLNECAC